MLDLTLCITYYNNPLMFRKQVDFWNTYPKEVKQKLKIIVIDDGSPIPVPLDITTDCNLEVYRILKDIPWNQCGARNLAATTAKTEWILFLDIDHILRPEYTMSLMQNAFEPRTINTFKRYRLMSEVPLKLSERISSTYLFAIRREDFFDIGGFDEDFSGSYGCEGVWFYKQAKRKSIRSVYWDNVSLCAYLGGDANTNLTRGKTRNKNLCRKKMSGIILPTTSSLRFLWKRVK